VTAKRSRARKIGAGVPHLDHPRPVADACSEPACKFLQMRPRTTAIGCGVERREIPATPTRTHAVRCSTIERYTPSRLSKPMSPFDNVSTITWSPGAGHAPRRFAPGDVIGAGRYRIVAAVGRGGMGVVYRADDLTLGQAVALKFIDSRYERNPAQLRRSVEEVRLARLVSHPNVCRVHDLVDAEGAQFIAMEYIDGEDLASLLRRVGRLSSEKALDVARQASIGSHARASVSYRVSLEMGDETRTSYSQTRETSRLHLSVVEPASFPICSDSVTLFRLETSNSGVTASTRKL
jgi:hypothetical protein